ncbi:glucokinase, partial [Francisella tularensis]
RMSNMLKEFPVNIIMNTDVGLIGARTFAAGLVK